MRKTHPSAIAVCALALFVLLFIPTGCRRAESEQPDPQAQADSLVEQGDAAWNAGDAEQAYELYTDALRTVDATGSADDLDAKQDAAKRLMLSRQILATQQPSLVAISPYVQVLQYSSPDTTEAAVARDKLADCLVAYPSKMRTEVNAIAAAIKANKGVESPLTVGLVSELAEDWESRVEDAPGATGRHLSAATREMKKAANIVLAALDKEYAEDVLAALPVARKHLAAADREIKAARKEQ